MPATLKPATVRDAGGHLGTFEPAASAGGVVEITMADGRRAEAPSAALRRLDDGTYLLPIDLGDAGAAERAGVVVIPLVAEAATVGKRVVETGKVRLNKRVTTRVEPVDVALYREEVEVVRVPKGTPVDEAPAIRHEGDTMIVPVVEEVLVVTKRLVLREELRVTRRRVEHRERRDVTLRAEEVAVEREGAGPDAGR